MKMKRENNYHYTELDIPVVLNDVEMTLKNGQWLPNIDSETVATCLIRRLAVKEFPLIGNEVRFIRACLGMSLRDFAAQVAHESHVAVKKWEGKSNELTKMNANTEFVIRSYLIDNLFDKSDSAVYQGLIQQAKRFYANQGVVNLVNSIDLADKQDNIALAPSTNCRDNQLTPLSNQDYETLTECANYRNQSIEKQLKLLIDKEKQQIEFDKKRIEREKKEKARESAKTYNRRTAKIGKPFKKHFPSTGFLYHPMDLVHDSDDFIEELVESKVISGKVVAEKIVKSKLFKITRSAYFSFGMEIAHFVGSKDGTKHVFLTGGLFRVEHHCAFVGMPDNVEVSVRLYSFLMSQAKKAKTDFLRTLSKRMKSSNKSKRAKDYMLDWVQAFGGICGYDELYDNDSYELLCQFSSEQWDTKD
tara:strand:- start:4117 stop:5367 length:1251 start_codon:yes stop_codon:yes gene_type:complete